MIPTGLGPRAQQIYDSLLAPMKPEDFLSHTDWKNLGTRSDLYSAQKKLLREEGRTLENDRGKGYRMVRAAEHVRLGRKRVDKARRQTRRGQRIVEAALEKHLPELTLSEVKEHQEFREGISRLSSAMRHMAYRQERHQQALASLETHKANREELEEIKQTVEMLVEKLGLRKAA